MLAGELYRPGDAEIAADQAANKAWLVRYNAALALPASERHALLSERFDGVASFGRRPTFDNGAPLLEIFLFDFKGDLYGATLDVAFIGFIREELKFDSVEKLVRQMDDDSGRARAALAAAPDAFPKLGIIDPSS